MEKYSSKMWWVIFVMCWCSVVYVKPQSSSFAPCFPSCKCDDSGTVFCSADRVFIQQVNKFNKYLLNTSSQVKHKIHIQTENTTLPAFLPRIPMLHNLSLAQNNLHLVQSGVLKGMRLRTLNLSHNHIQNIEEEAFYDLSYLQVLDLSFNQLSSISKLVFASLPNLRLLNLDFNHLLYFPFNAFSHVPRLEVLSVNHNRLSYLSPGALLGFSSLHRLQLRHNSLWSVAALVKEEAPAVKVVDIADNPFHCSCNIAGLKSVMNASAVVLLDPDLMRCFTPLSLRGQHVVDVVPHLHECQKPLSMLDYDSQTVFYTGDLHLSCDIQGDPDPAILWSTPWGHQFADPSHLARLESVCTACRQQRHYHSRAVSLESTVVVGQGGKSLSIINFRGMFSGNITCHAYNYLGNDSTLHMVNIRSGVRDTFLDSLYAGAFSAGGFLCFGLLVGSIKMTVQACRVRFGKRQKVVRTPTTAMLSYRGDSLTREDFRCRYYSLDFSTDSDSPPGTPSLLLSSSLTSPPSILTPEEEEEQDAPTDARRASNIVETMEDVRWRLRHGMGRRMKTVKRNVQSIRETGRRNVQSIRESGSVYMQNIRDTGSTAASKVKAGVVMGMESVKLHVQSIKEFCGTGDMGNHTVSAVSMETNLDTDETTAIVKSVTIV